MWIRIGLCVAVGLVRTRASADRGAFVWCPAAQCWAGALLVRRGASADGLLTCSRQRSLAQPSSGPPRCFFWFACRLRAAGFAGSGS